MTVSPVLDAAGRRRSPATMPGYHAGRPPRNKGLRYPADPPTVEEIIAVMRDRRRRSARLSAARADRRALARRAAHPRSARAERGRPRPPPRLAARPPRQGRPPPRGRHGRLGLGAARAVARRARRAADRSAVLRHQRPHPRTRRGRAQRRARRAAPRRRPTPAFAAASRRTSCATRTRVELAREGVPLNVIQRQLGHTQPRHHLDGSGRGAVTALPPVRFLAPPSEPDVRVPAHPALHRTCDGRSCRSLRQRRTPVEWWLVLFRGAPTARGCCGRDSDIASLVPRRARRVSCLRGWSSGAPSTVA